MIAMKLLLLFLVAFQFSSVICQSEEYDEYEEYDDECHRPEQLSRPSSKIVTDCLCDDEVTSGEVCHCHTDYKDLEETPVANAKNKVRAFLTKKLCWEKNQGDETRFYENCAEVADGDCLFEDKIEICHTDNIDAAQALCRHFNKGDAYDAVASAEERKLRRRNKIKKGKRTYLAELDCLEHAENLKNCSLKILSDDVKECDQMVAHCWFSACWQPQHSIRAIVGDGSNTRTGAVYGKVRYGQACKEGGYGGGSAICKAHCFRCPDAWTNIAGNSVYDGTRCFAAAGGNSQGYLTWEPHFRTLDGKHFDFQGQCSYYLIKNAHFHIIAKFSVCGKYGVTCTSELTIKSGLTELRLGQGNDFSVKYRNRLMTKAKKPYHNNDINYYLASSEFDAVDVWNGFKILWDRKAEYKTVLPGWNNVFTRGMLGNFNNDATDDMMMPNGVVTNDPVEFGNSWLVPGSCPPGVSPNAPQNPVLTNQEKNEAHEYCKYINPDGAYMIPDPFKNCSSPEAMVERRAEYSNCLMDMGTCFASRAKSECLCSSFEFLADFCENKEEGVGNWRALMPNSLCKLDCDGKIPNAKGEVFREDANPCTQTCDAIKYQKAKVFECIPMKVSGCNCPVGKARNDQGICILLAECPN